MNNIKDFFNSLAPTWDKNEVNIKQINKLLLSLPIKKNDFILDLGCGTGKISSLLQDITKSNVIALDLSDKMIDIAKAKNKNKNITFLCDDYYSFTYPTLFDSIICFDAYPHFVDINKFKEKSYNLIKKDGFLIILFDISLKDINDCHHNLPFTLARQINTPDKEGLIFNDSFNIIKAEESSNSYLLILQKK